ncbi:MAG: HlyC/CorC family transporter [Alphaproteobacteria bacterium]|nr:HlyC/CorC family transporter [Alphaproteobacteria bacterium]
MSELWFEIAVVLALVVVNGALAMAEMALVSAKKARLQAQAESHAGARAALRLIAEPGRYLSTIQVGITLIGMLAGAFSGATIAERVAVWLRPMAPVAAYADALAIGGVVVAITFVSLVAGELVPKRIALAHAETLAIALARPFEWAVRALGPVARVLDWTSDALLRLMGIRRRDAVPVTEEEIDLMLKEGAAAGAFEHKERELVKNVFRLGDREVGQIMTPRTEVVFLDLAEDVAVNLKRIADSPHTRFPVIDGDPENVIGIVAVKEIAAQSFAGRPVDLRAALRPPFFVPETTSALALIELFRTHRSQMALAVDEYGVIQGVATLGDILETVVGAVPASDGKSEQPMLTRRGDGSWLVDGMLPVDELKELLAVKALPGEQLGFRTLAGFVMARLGRVPAAADAFAWANFRFEVVDMDGKRIDKVLIVPPPPARKGTTTP